MPYVDVRQERFLTVRVSTVTRSSVFQKFAAALPPLKLGGVMVMPSRNENLGNRKARVIETTIRLLESHSYEKTTIGLIAQESKIGERSIYSYFGNKQKLLLECYNYSWRIKILEKFRGTQREEQSPSEQLKNLALIVVDALQDPSLASLLLLESRKPILHADFSLDHGFGNFMEIWERLISKALPDKPKEQAEAVASSLLGALEGLLRDWFYVQSGRYINYPANYSVDDLKNQISSMIALCLGDAQ